MRYGDLGGRGRVYDSSGELILMKGEVPMGKAVLRFGVYRSLPSSKPFLLDFYDGSVFLSDRRLAGIRRPDPRKAALARLSYTADMDVLETADRTRMVLEKGGFEFFSVRLDEVLRAAHFHPPPRSPFIRGRRADAGESMGRSVPTYRLKLEELIAGLGDYRRALREEDRRAFDALMNRARRYASAAGFQASSDPMETALLSMLVGIEKELGALRGEAAGDGTAAASLRAGGPPRAAPAPGPAQAAPAGGPTQAAAPQEPPYTAPLEKPPQPAPARAPPQKAPAGGCPP